MENHSSDRSFSYLSPSLISGGATGRNIAIAIIDSGFDILHPALLQPSRDRTRFAHLWKQDLPSPNRAENHPDENAKKPVCSSGSIDFDQRQLDLLISRARDAFSRGPVDQVYDPHDPGTPEGPARATMLASIAAGTRHRGHKGMATDAMLIAIHPAVHDHHWRDMNQSGNPTWANWDPATTTSWNDWRSYDESPALISALEFAYARAEMLKADGLVVCLPDGAWPGLHDGSSSLERKMIELFDRGRVSDGLPCLIVTTNTFAALPPPSCITELLPRSSIELSWLVNAGRQAPCKLEIWHASTNSITAELKLGDPHPATGSPRIAARFPIEPGRTTPIRFGRNLMGIADHSRSARPGHDCIRISLHPPLFPHSIALNKSAEAQWLLHLENTVDTHLEPLRIVRDDASTTVSIFSQPGEPQIRCLVPPPATPGTLRVEVDEQAQFIRRRKSLHRNMKHAISKTRPSASRSPPVQIACPPISIWAAHSKTSDYLPTSGAAPAAALLTGAVACALETCIRRGNPSPGWDEVLPLLLPIPSEKP